MAERQRPNILEETRLKSTVSAVLREVVDLYEGLGPGEVNRTRLIGLRLYAAQAWGFRVGLIYSGGEISVGDIHELRRKAILAETDLRVEVFDRYDGMDHREYFAGRETIEEAFRFGIEVTRGERDFSDLLEVRKDLLGNRIDEGIDLFGRRRLVSVRIPPYISQPSGPEQLAQGYPWLAGETGDPRGDQY